MNKVDGKSIAFDSANKTGYAYHSGVWITGVIKMHGRASKHRTEQRQHIVRVLNDAVSCGCRCAVIEDCFHGRSLSSFKSQVDTMTRIRVECERLGIPVRMVAPSEWQAAQGINGGREVGKEKAKRLAEILGARGRSEDENEAVCMCDYANNNAEVGK